MSLIEEYEDLFTLIKDCNTTEESFNKMKAYFNNLLKHDRLTGQSVTINKYVGIENFFIKEIIPLHKDIILNKKQQIMNAKRNRSFWKYIVITIGFLEFIEVIVTRGKSLSPQIFIPTVILEGLLGATFYGIANFIDYVKLVRAKSKFNIQVNEIYVTYTFDKDFDNITENLMDDIELIPIKLDDYSSDWKSFWEHFDCLCKDEKRFNLWVNDKNLMPEEKEAYLKALFVKAHEYFVDKFGISYVLQNLIRR